MLDKIFLIFSHFIKNSKKNLKKILYGRLQRNTLVPLPSFFSSPHEHMKYNAEKIFFRQSNYVYLFRLRRKRRKNLIQFMVSIISFVSMNLSV